LLPGVIKDRYGRKLNRIQTWKVIELMKNEKRGEEKETQMGWFDGVRQQVS
jgi:hypothetical protein